MPKIKKSPSTHYRRITADDEDAVENINDGKSNIDLVMNRGKNPD
jgi:hypothetical protein